MAINRISLKNFKCFQETDIEFGKITLLTGANSSGKSSLIHAILAILQTEGFPFYLSPNGKYVNMGDFEEMVFGHDLTQTISLDAEIASTTFRSEWVSNGRNRLPELKRLSVIGDDTAELQKRDTFWLKVSQSDSLDMWLRAGDTLGLWPEDNVFSDALNEAEQRLIKAVEDSKGEFFNTQLTDLEILADFFFQRIGMLSMEALEGATFNCNYISPFRLPPERTYYQTSDITQKIGTNGQGYIDQIVEWEDNKAPELQELTETLSALKLLRKIKTQRLKGGRFELRVQVSSNKLWASLADVGFGISQFLPIIVADLQLKDDSTLILAQPEIHLHPNVQATLGDYFVKQATQKNKRYLVETHSEYLLNRIRLAIVKKEIKAEEVAVYYFENTPQGSETHRLTFTEDGQIQHAPKGFFDTYMIDTMEIALHA